jgi:hypothetical protein
MASACLYLLLFMLPIQSTLTRYNSFGNSHEIQSEAADRKVPKDSRHLRNYVQFEQNLRTYLIDFPADPPTLHLPQWYPASNPDWHV